MFIVTTTPPKVVILGQTACLDFHSVLAFAEEYGNTYLRNTRGKGLIPTLAGAVCYDSFDNKAGRTNDEYLQSAIIDHEHYSVLEHFTYNFGVSHLPRTVLMELTRHRVGVAYSWRSTRYTDSWVEYIVPPNIRGNEDLEAIFRAQARDNYELYQAIKDGIKGQEKGLNKKQRTEAARAALWGSIGTQGVFSVNVRELRHILLLRTAEGADESFREFAYALWDAVEEDANTFFPDFIIPDDRSKAITRG